MPSLLNNERISTQLRDWKQIAGQKALATAGLPESRSYTAEVMRYMLILEYIDALHNALTAEQQAHLLTKGALMVREAELAAERKLYKAARPGKQMPRPEQRCEPRREFWFGKAGAEFDNWGRRWVENNAGVTGLAPEKEVEK